MARVREDLLWAAQIAAGRENQYADVAEGCLVLGCHEPDEN